MRDDFELLVFFFACVIFDLLDKLCEKILKVGEVLVLVFSKFTIISYSLLISSSNFQRQLYLE